jgi:GNAT superfamily N-acetyltransferase
LSRSQENTVQNRNSAHPDRSQASKDAGLKTVRRATTADAAAVRELTRAAYAKWVPILGREPRPMTADYDAALRDHLVDLLHVGGEAVALIEMAPTADHLLIVNVAVVPAQRGRGHGRALMAHAEEVARSLNLSEMRLYTNALFAENLRLYSRLGYRVDREEQHPQFGVTVYMSKRLGAIADEHSSNRTSP